MNTRTSLSLGLFSLLSVSPAFAATVDNPSHGVATEDVWNEAVVNGTQASPGLWPDTAGVYYGSELGCTGTLIAPNVVLTAGHCIDGSISKVLLNSVDAAQGGEEISVTQSIAYPNWENSYDVGILLLAQPSTVTPRPMAPECAMQQYYTVGAPVEVVGYGASDAEGTEYGTKLLRADLTIRDTQCNPAGGTGCVSSISPGGEVIAGAPGVGSCFGDSGGPIYLKTEVGNFLLGSVSRGVENVQALCGIDGIYVRADAVRSWIEQTANVTLPVANCNGDVDPGDPEPGDPEPGDPSPGNPDPNTPDPGSPEAPGGSTSVGGCSTSQRGGFLPLLFGLALLPIRTRRRNR